jgi:hypothetical protein
MAGGFLWEKLMLESLFSCFYKNLPAFSYPELRLNRSRKKYSKSAKSIVRSGLKAA